MLILRHFSLFTQVHVFCDCNEKDLLILTFFLYTNISRILKVSNCSRIRIWDTLGVKLIPAVYSVVFDLKWLISRHLRYGIRLAGMVIHTRQSTEHFGDHQQCNNAGRLLEWLLSWQVFHYGRWQGGPAIWYTSLLPLNCLQGNTRATKGSLTSITNSGLGIGLGLGGEGGGAKKKKVTLKQQHVNLKAERTVGRQLP